MAENAPTRGVRVGVAIVLAALVLVVQGSLALENHNSIVLDQLSRTHNELYGGQAHNFAQTIRLL